MKPHKQQYYINYTFFKGDEHTGESTRSGHILEAESDKDALSKLTEYVAKERGGEVTQVHIVQNVTGLLELVADSIQVESDLHEAEGQNSSEFSDYQKYNVGFAVAHWLYCRK